MNLNKTLHLKAERKYYLIDASGKILGRLAVQIAKILMGKNKENFSYHIDNGDFVVVINAEKIKVTGKKMLNKLYYFHSGYKGHLKIRTLKWMIENKPEKVLYMAVRKMLPKNALRDKRMKRLKIFVGEKHNITLPLIKID